jgi:hypothetical protein
VPTVAALAGIDVSDLSFEGQSLVPQIFFGKEEPERIVFAETNWPRPLRAAVSSRYKLVYNLQNNLEELYDLRSDPWEKDNIASRDRTSTAMMKDALDRWLERVVYSRDATYNQAASKMAEVLLPARPTPARPTPGVSFDGGRLAVLGFSSKAETVRAGDKLEVEVFFEVADRPSGSFKLQLVAWTAPTSAAATAATPAMMSRGPLRLTLDGMFPSDRWRKGEFIREKLTVPVPREWTGESLVLALGLTDGQGKRLPAAGPAPANDPALAVLGALPLQAPPPAPPSVPGAPVPVPAR